MAGWNYRVIKWIRPNKTHEYLIQEAYYDDNDKVISITTDSLGISPYSDGTLDAFLLVFNRYIQALTKPVVIFEEKTGKILGEEPLDKSKVYVILESILDKLRKDE